MLSGFKTYIIAVLVAVLAILRYFDVFSLEVFNGLFTLLVGGGLASLRAGVKSAVKV